MSIVEVAVELDKLSVRELSSIIGDDSMREMLNLQTMSFQTKL